MPLKDLITGIRLTWQNGIHYLPLLKNLIGRELKKRYRGSVLGYAWCVLNPLLIMLIMTFVFSQMFHQSIQNYPVYLFIGRMFYSLITGGAGSILRSITGNGALMRKTRVPYYIFPLSSFCSSAVDLLFTLIAFVVVLVVTQTPIGPQVLFFPVIVLEALLMTFGIGLLLAVANVFVRDVSYLWGVFCTAWMYLSALFYPVTSLPETLRYLVEHFNPLYIVIAQARGIFLDMVLPEAWTLLAGFGFSAVMCVLGLLAYWRARDSLILYV